MSNFAVKIQRIFIKPHSNADALELGNIGSPDGWQVVVKRGQYKTGDLVAYIGENSVVCENTLRKYGFWNEEKNIGMLAGSKGDRVKAIRLRGEFSLGICIPVKENFGGYYSIPHCDDGEDRIVNEGENVDFILGVSKYEPPIPIALAGEVFNLGQHLTVDYDIENIKNYPDVLVEGEEVQCTIKIHGTNLQLIYLPNINDMAPHVHEELLFIDNVLANDEDNTSGFVGVVSKGLGAQGLCFKWNEANKNNVYQRAVHNQLSHIVRALNQAEFKEPVVIMGEVFGEGIQDLTYGVKRGNIGFKVFDIYVGFRNAGRFLNDDELDQLCALLELPRVEVVYRGPFSKAKIDELVQGVYDTFDGKKEVREGVVIKPVIERRDSGLGRVVLKSINESYLLRKGGTEYN
jgi:RNA ligase (TIGR02306 family)